MGIGKCEYFPGDDPNRTDTCDACGKEVKKIDLEWATTDGLPGIHLVCDKECSHKLYLKIFGYDSDEEELSEYYRLREKYGK